MSTLTQFLGGGGGDKPFVDLGVVTGTVTLDYSKNSAYKIVQGAGNLEILLNKDPEIRTEGDLFLEINSGYSLSLDPEVQSVYFNIDAGPYDLSGSASHTGAKFDVTNELAVDANGLAFNPEGTIMIVSSAYDVLYQYSLQKPFDITTASYTGVSYDLQAYNIESNLVDIAFNPEGTKLFTLGRESDSVNQFSLSTPFDLSTTSYDNVSFSVQTQDTSPIAFTFNPEGTKMFMFGASYIVCQYDLTTGFDISTASYSGVTYTTNQSGLEAIKFDPSGTKMFISNSTNRYIIVYSLGISFDISTVVMEGSLNVYTSDVSTRILEPSSFCFNGGGDRLFIMDTRENEVHGFVLSAVHKISQYGENLGITTEKYTYVV